MPSNMDMYTKHLSDWAHKERVTGFRSIGERDPVEQPDVVIDDAPDEPASEEESSEEQSDSSDSED